MTETVAAVNAASVEKCTGGLIIFLLMSAAAESLNRLFSFMENALHDKKFHDVQFQVGSEHSRFSANRTVLSMRSTYFWAMFYGPSKFRESQPDAIVLEPDVDPSAFQNVLQYCYTDTASLNEENVIATLHAAHKYNLEFLQQACTSWLQAHISVESCCIIYQQANIFSNEELMRQADEYGIQTIILHFMRLS